MDISARESLESQTFIESKRRQTEFFPALFWPIRKRQRPVWVPCGKVRYCPKAWMAASGSLTTPVAAWKSWRHANEVMPRYAKLLMRLLGSFSRTCCFQSTIPDVFRPRDTPVEFPSFFKTATGEDRPAMEKRRKNRMFLSRTNERRHALMSAGSGQGGEQTRKLNF